MKATPGDVCKPDFEKYLYLQELFDRCIAISTAKRCLGLAVVEKMEVLNWASALKVFKKCLAWRFCL